MAKTEKATARSFSVAIHAVHAISEPYDEGSQGRNIAMFGFNVVIYTEIFTFCAYFTTLCRFIATS